VLPGNRRHVHPQVAPEVRQGLPDAEPAVQDSTIDVQILRCEVVPVSQVAVVFAPFPDPGRGVVHHEHALVSLDTGGKTRLRVRLVMATMAAVSIGCAVVGNQGVDLLPGRPKRIDR
jgi:hypothetical protein